MRHSKISCRPLPMLTFSRKMAKWQSDHLAQVAAQPIVRRQAAMSRHHKMSLADLM
jgi:hypothetical protein